MSRPLRPVVEALRAARLDQGLSQREVARRMRTDSAHMSRMEAGLTAPTLPVAERWATALGLRIAVVSVSS